MVRTNLSKDFTALAENHFEEEARTLCLAEGCDPDSREMYPDPRGFAVAHYRPAWVSRAIRLREHWISSDLVSRTLRRLGI